MTTATQPAPIENLHPCVTNEKPEKHSSDSGLSAPVSRIGGNIIVLPVKGRTMDIMRVNTLKRMKLREEFEYEANSHRALMQRVREGIRTVHPDFTDLRSFLRIIIREIGRRPPGCTLDRINNADLEYGPGKVKWSTFQEQCRNRSSTIMVNVRGKDVALADESEKRGLKPATVLRRIKRAGCTVDEALSRSKGTRRTKAKATVPVLLQAPAPAPAMNHALAPVWAVWQAAWAHKYAGNPLRWTGKELGQVRIMVKRIAETDTNPAEFVEWSTRHWHAVISSYLRCLGQRELSISILAGYLDVFFAARAAQARQQAEKRDLHKRVNAAEAKRAADEAVRRSQPVPPAPPRGPFRLVERTPIDWSIKPEDVDLDALYAGIGPWVDEP